MSEAEHTLSAEAGLQLHLFRSSLPLQLKVAEVRRQLGNTDGLACLDIGVANGIVSYQLRQGGGEWASAVRDERTAATVREVAGGDAQIIQGAGLSFENKTFDVVVILDFLERVAADEAFIEECHRILRPDGRLIVNAAHVKRGSLLNPLRALVRRSGEAPTLPRAGYTESELFRILKHGFDVVQMRSYSRFFVELTRTVMEAVGAGNERREGQDMKRFMRRHTTAGMLYRVAFQLDWLLFFTRGHYLIASAKRRAWRPRRAPVLTDGRSITEVVLSKAPP